MTTKQTEPNTTPRLGRYLIDIENSTVTFGIRHLFGLAAVSGSVSIAAGDVDVAEPMGDSQVRAQLAATSFRTGNRQRDDNVRSARFLDVDRYPMMTFTTSRLRGSTLEGTLAIRGVTQPVTLAIVDTDVRPQSFTVRAATRIDRTQFGVRALRWVVGRYLDVAIEVRCVRG